MKTETTATFIVMNQEYVYEYYNTNVIRKGTRMRVGPRPTGSGFLQEDGFVLIIGHGADVLIPRDRFDIEDVVTETVTTTRRTRR